MQFIPKWSFWFYRICRVRVALRCVVLFVCLMEKEREEEAEEEEEESSHSNKSKRSMPSHPEDDLKMVLRFGVFWQQQHDMGVRAKQAPTWADHGYGSRTCWLCCSSIALSGCLTATRLPGCLPCPLALKSGEPELPPALPPDRPAALKPRP